MPRRQMFGSAPFSSLATTVSMLALACGETTDIPQIQLGNDTVAETGFPVHDIGPGQLDPDQCLTEAKPGAYGIKYQCQGLITLRLDWVYDAEPHFIEFPEIDIERELGNAFGAYESYGAAYVTACCGEFQGDPQDSEDFVSQPQYALSCIQDARDQACISIEYALSKLIGQIPNAFDSIAERQAMKEVRDYISMHAQDCWDELGDGFPTPFVFQLFDDTWFIDSNWTDNDLASVYFSINVSVASVYAPETGYDTCEDLHGNDTHIIPLTWPNKFSSVLPLALDEGDASIEGPVYGSSNITATDDFESEMTSCTGSACSRGSISMNELGDWAIDEMILNVDGDLVFGNTSTETEIVTDARLELYGPALGTIVTGIPPLPDEYTIPVGGAQFLAVGKADGDDEWVMLPVVNSTGITATEIAGEWTFEPFEVEYTDDSNNLWTISISETVWLED